MTATHDATYVTTELLLQIENNRQRYTTGTGMKSV